MKAKFALAVLTLLLLNETYSQNKVDIVEGMYRPKLAEFSYQSLFQQQTVSTSESFGNANHTIERSNILKAKMGIPLVMKEGMLLGMQLAYSQQRFNLGIDENSIDYDLYRYLNRTTFHTTGARFLFQKDFNELSKLTLYAGTDFKSGSWKKRIYSTKYFVGGLYLRLINSTTQIGYGGLIAQELGTWQVIPLFKFEKQFSRKFTMDLTLPKFAAARYEVNPRMYLIAKAELKGSRFSMDGSFYGEERDFVLRRGDVQFSLTLEREIHDWLWVSFEGGYYKNLRYFMANPTDRYQDAIIDIASKDTGFMRVNLFIVPPWKMCQPK